MVRREMKKLFFAVLVLAVLSLSYLTLLSLNWQQSEETKWKAGFSAEVRFWEQWFRSGGGEVHDRSDPEYEFWFCDDLMSILGPKPQKPDYVGSEPKPVVLDVGAGPLSRCGHRCGSKYIEIIATDPLAFLYDPLLQYYNVTPPARSITMKGEELETRFAANFFDMAYSVNALDHTQDPVEVLRQMLVVTKPGGMVLVQGNTNEAINEGYSGFHQWNFAHLENRMIVFGKGGSERDVFHILRAMLASAYCDVESLRFGRTETGQMTCKLVKGQGAA